MVKIKQATIESLWRDIKESKMNSEIFRLIYPDLCGEIEQNGKKLSNPLTRLQLYEIFGVEPIPIDPAKWRYQYEDIPKDQKPLYYFFEKKKEETFVSDSERIIRKYFEKLGFGVIRGYSKKLPKDIKEKIRNYTGVPDFFVFNDKERFFVEVKTSKDTLRVSQMEWVSEHSKFFPIKIAVVKSNEIRFMTIEMVMA